MPLGSECVITRIFNLKLFVYGTLKKGFGLNSILTNSKFLGEHITKPGYSMSGVSFPLVWKDKNSNYKIKGELYEPTKSDLRFANNIEMGAGYNLEEIEKGIYAYIYPNPWIMKSPQVKLNTDKKYYEWRSRDEMYSV